MGRSAFVYVTYIRTTPERLWSALTDVKFIEQYWFGNRCESQWTVGSSWKMVSALRARVASAWWRTAPQISRQRFR